MYDSLVQFSETQVICKVCSPLFSPNSSSKLTLHSASFVSDHGIITLGINLAHTFSVVLCNEESTGSLIGLTCHVCEKDVPLVK